MEALAKLPHLSSQLMFYTDDMPPDQLVPHGGISDVLRRITAEGLDPVDAIRFATFNAALHFGSTIWELCAGRIADLVILSDLEAVRVSDVFVSGRHAAHDGRMISEVLQPAVPVPAGSVHITPRTVEDFLLRVASGSNGRARLKTIKGVRFSEWGAVDVEVKDGCAVLPPPEGPGGHLNFLYMQHRHGRHESQPQMALRKACLD